MSKFVLLYPLTTKWVQEDTLLDIFTVLREPRVLQTSIDDISLSRLTRAHTDVAKLKMAHEYNRAPWLVDAPL